MEGFMLYRRLKVFTVIITIIFSVSLIDHAKAGETAKDDAWKTLLGSIEEVSTADLLKVLIGDNGASDVPPAMLAHLLYIKQHFDLAAFYFKIDYDLNPQNVESLSNLAGILVELNAEDSKKYPQSFLDWAVAAATKASLLSPDNPSIQNTLSFVLQTAAEHELNNRPDIAQELLNRADKASRKATKSDPNSPVYWTNLARVWHLKGNAQSANYSLNRAFQADPKSLAVLFTAASLGVKLDDKKTESYPETPTGAQCAIDFKCAEICPKSIIGQVNFVACMLENDNQKNNCTAGKPYATAYNCEEEFPVFGAVPGLSSVVSICLPGICAHIRIKNADEIDVRIEAGPNLGPFKTIIGADGHFSNKNGFSYDRLTSEIKVSLFNRSAAGNLSGKISEINPLEIKISKSEGKEQKINATAMGHSLIEF